MSNSGFPMLSGREEASYAANSGPQNSVLLRARPILEKAIAMQQARLLEMERSCNKRRMEVAAAGRSGRLSAAAEEEEEEEEAGDVHVLDKVFRIADLGCSVGPNCLSNMQFMLEAVLRYGRRTAMAEGGSDGAGEGEGKEEVMEVQSLFCDLPSNDFNTLLQLQHARYQNGQGGRGRFSAAVAGSVYGRLFPASSLHLVFSSFCLHWLSRIPHSICTQGTMEWNEGKIWVDGLHAKEATGMAYFHQWKQDLNMFLRCRLKEMVNGGMIFLIIPCRDDSLPPHQMQKESCFRNLELSWKELIQEGVLEQNDLDSFNIPFYFPTLSELQIAVTSILELRIQSMEVIEETVGDNYWRQWSHQPTVWATRVNNFYKSLLWNVIKGHVGAAKCEAIFRRFKELLEKSLNNQSSWDSYWAHPWSSFATLHILKGM